eukprot:GABV01000674.1.p1 GENE.GABV01000674.1~~GABV01000674.1.p1  ORF type:complete len:277 (-),score=38.86 GABV01000674.1:5-835(-)
MMIKRLILQKLDLTHSKVSPPAFFVALNATDSKPSITILLAVFHFQFHPDSTIIHAPLSRSASVSIISRSKNPLKVLPVHLARSSGPTTIQPANPPLHNANRFENTHILAPFDTHDNGSPSAHAALALHEAKQRKLRARRPATDAIDLGDQIRTTFYKQIKFVRLPEILCLHIHRLLGDFKFSHHVDFPFELDVPVVDNHQYAAPASAGVQAMKNLLNGFHHPNGLWMGGARDPTETFELQAVIEHRGDARGGHFVTYRRFKKNFGRCVQIETSSE